MKWRFAHSFVIPSEVEEALVMASDTDPLQL
jgi:hypothetical protein